MSSEGMKKPEKPPISDAARFREQSNVVLLDPDVAAEFKDSEAVNAALRALLKDRSEQ